MRVFALLVVVVTLVGLFVGVRYAESLGNRVAAAEVLR
jgi:hypothetical protein